MHIRCIVLHALVTAVIEAVGYRSNPSPWIFLCCIDRESSRESSSSRRFRSPAAYYWTYTFVPLLPVRVRSRALMSPLVRRALYKPSLAPRYSRALHRSAVMSSASTSPALHALVTATSQAPRRPADAGKLAHHNANGQGFNNPWPSWNMLSVFTIVWGMVSYASPRWSTNSLIHDPD